MYRSLSTPERLVRTGASPYLEISCVLVSDVQLSISQIPGVLTTESWYKNGTTSLEGTGVRGRLGTGDESLTSAADEGFLSLCLEYEFDLCSFPAVCVGKLVSELSLPEYSSPKKPCNFLCIPVLTTLPRDPLLPDVATLARDGRLSSSGASASGSLNVRDVPGLILGDNCEFMEWLSLESS